MGMNQCAKTKLIGTLETHGDEQLFFITITIDATKIKAGGIDPYPHTLDPITYGEINYTLGELQQTEPLQAVPLTLAALCMSVQVYHALTGFA